jgi:outer membrane protein assembly factor BamA
MSAFRRRYGPGGRRKLLLSMLSCLRRVRRNVVALVALASLTYPNAAPAVAGGAPGAAQPAATSTLAPTAAATAAPSVAPSPASAPLAAPTAGAPGSVPTAPAATPPPPPAPTLPSVPAPSRGKAPLIVSVDVTGNAHVPTDRILSVVRTRPGQPFDEQTLREDLQNIFDLGYFSDQVPPLIRQRPGGIAITFRVIENPVITRIVFTGNDHVPSDTLLALMDTSVGQVLNSNTFHQDVLKINSYYDKIGYGGQVPSHVANLSYDKGVLSLQIREGLTVDKITFGGNPLLSPKILQSVLTLKPGQPYSDDARDKDYENLKKLYEKYDLQLGDFEAGIDPTTVDLAKGTADVKYTIYVATVGAVQITGNTKTHDIVIRRQLRLRPGMIITQGLLRRDYERLNNLGFFEKVDLNPKPGPDPKKPYEVTLDWSVKEQRTGTAQVGAGYSGGPTGQGLTGTLSYSQNNINGTGNGASVRFERGANVSDAEVSLSIPYLGNTPKSEKYSLGASVFTSAQRNFYAVYQASSSQSLGGFNPIVSTPAPTGGTAGSSNVSGQPVVLTPNANLIGGIAANYGNRADGLSVNVGRRLTDTLTGSLGVSVQRLATNVTLPSGYFLAGTQTIFNNPNVNTPFGTTTNGTTLGINAPSIADTSNGAGYNLRALSFGLQNDTRDDIFNPRRGVNTSLTEEVSGRALGSQFGYTITTFDGAKFFPVGKTETLGFHALVGDATGAIPPSKLFVLTDQQLRGYSQVFYGTEELLLQSEFRVPISPDRKFNIALFYDYGGQRIRGAQPIVDSFGNTLVDYSKFLYRTDGGIGLRFDVPQLGFKSIRLDFARGKGGSHTSFGIGQSF